MSGTSKSLDAFDHPAVAIDLALITVVEGELRVLLIRRDDAESVGGDWALPGGFVHVDKSLEETVEKVLKEKANVSGIYLEQLGTFGEPGRDPRGRVISVAYFGLIAAEVLFKAYRSTGSLNLARLSVPWKGELGGPVEALDDHRKPLSLAFDHADLIGQVVKRLRGKLDYTAIGLELLPKRFTLRDAQDIHEAILGRELTKPAFRRKLIDRGLVRATGEREAAGAFRPAELYEHVKNT